MSNQTALAGGQPQKQTKFASIYTGRWYSGIWTNRSPLRDANTTRLVEKFYGSAGDALIAGLNVEITHRLTLARRPGNSVWNNQTWTNVDRFIEFQLFSPNIEQIKILVDQANAFYQASQQSVPSQPGDALNQKTLIWTKSTNAGQTYAQTVGNSLYFGNGIDQKKWLQSLILWQAGIQWNTASNPFLSTFLIDTNGNIQQLTSAIVPINTIAINGSNVGTVTTSVTFPGGVNLTNVLTVGLSVLFPSGLNASFLNNQTVVITAVTSNSFSFAFTHASYGPTSETSKICTVVQGGTPYSATSGPPVWNTTVPSSGNNYQGGLTNDATVQWTNRGNPIENWGIVAGTTAVKPTITGTSGAWAAFTFYSLPGVIVDSNSNIWSVSVAGKSGTVYPFPGSPSLNQTVIDNGITWKCIQLVATTSWAAHTAYTFSNPPTIGSFLINSANGTNCLFQLQAQTLPTISQQTGSPIPNMSAGDYVDYYFYSGSGSGGVFAPYPATAGGATSESKFNSLLNNIGGDPSSPMTNFTLNNSGEITGFTFPGYSSNYSSVSLSSITFPVSGQYNILLNHDDGAFFGFGAGVSSSQVPSYVSGPQVVCGPGSAFVTTAMNTYTVIGGTNQNGFQSDQFVVNIPAADTYPLEIDYFQNSGPNTLVMQINGFTPIPVATGTNPRSMGVVPIWPGWVLTNAPAYPSVLEQASYLGPYGLYSPTGGALTWNNLGPVTDFVWKASTTYTLANTTITDPNINTEAPYEAGSTGALTSEPTFKTGINQLTKDNPNLVWINQGPAAAPPPGTISAPNVGWNYTVALVNTLDNTVSNGSPLSASTGVVIGATGISIAAGAGLPPTAQIDPQADYVAVFRTTDGGPTPFLIPGTGNSIYTIPLSTYLVSGYTDTTPDVNLNNQISAAMAGQNTPPAAGAINLVYHLNRIFFSIGNTVYWTSGPNTPVGNGVNGVSPLNFDGVPSLVQRIVPTVLGALIFTVSDVYLIQGQGTASNPIQPAQPYEPGIGIRSYNALDINGSLIGFYTNDNQFCIFDPSAGVSSYGQPIGDQIRLNNGQPGTAWNPNTAYVAWNVHGEDQAWYLADGQFGWYRLMTTPAPETGVTWSPYAQIIGGVKAVQQMETTPGLHQLLLGPNSTGPILARDLTTNTDNSNTYPAYAVLGSIVLANPGQLALVQYITTDSVVIGTPLTLSVLIDEALPYFTGPFEQLKDFENDPPDQSKSHSVLGQRFYVSEVENDQYAAMCRHMQIKIQWNQENYQNELLALSVFGGFLQEQ